MERLFPYQLLAMYLVTWSGPFMHSQPHRSNGGLDGVTKNLDQSIDLGNPSHIDVHDASVGILMWTELEPGRARDWYLIFPNVQVFHHGKVYYGLAIKLNHVGLVYHGMGGSCIMHRCQWWFCFNSYQSFFRDFFAAKNKTVWDAARKMV